jgi:signal peptidase II
MRFKKMIFGFSLIIFFLFDRFLKVIAINYFSDSPLALAGDYFEFSFAKNYNIAFSLPLSGWWLNVLIIIIIVGLVFYLCQSYKNRNYYKTLFLLFILLGAVSNLYDRLIQGYVIDYFDLKYFTVFNSADVMIVGGVIGIIFLNIKKKS